MNEREPIGKKLRFEVFKRDKFTCQYCGEKAPDVVLHIDHIKPVAEGGTSDILNLITSCHGCNSGKGARPLSDNSMLEKQRQQIEELEERRQQLEMMLLWRDELASFGEGIIDAVVLSLDENTGRVPNKNGRAHIKKWLKKYSVEEILTAADESADVYLIYVNDECTAPSWELFFKKIPVFAKIQKDSVAKPYLRDLFYMRGIVRNRVDNRWYDCLDLLERTILAGASVDSLMTTCKTITCEEDLEGICESFINAQRKKKDA